MQEFGKTLLFAGVLLTIAGIVLLVAPRVPFLGRLPGDIRIEREHFRFFFPLGTCLLLSAVLSLISWLLRR